MVHSGCVYTCQFGTYFITFSLDDGVITYLKSLNAAIYYSDVIW